LLPQACSLSKNSSRSQAIATGTIHYTGHFTGLTSTAWYYADANAKGLTGEGKGDARKAFMKECLSAKPEKAAAGASQQNKMTTCNKDAKAKKLAGDERKKFMKECLSN
jgi:hypothetical protein